VTDGVHSHPLVLTIAIALTAAAAWHVYHFHRENRSWKVSGPEISRAHDYFSNLVRVFSLHSDAVDALEDRLRELWPHAEHEWQLDTMRVVVELGHGLGRAKADLQMIIDALQQRQRPLVIFNLFQAAAPDFNGAELIAWLASNPIASALRHAGAGKELQALVDNYNEGENILFTAPSVNAAMVPFFPPAINSGELKDLKPPLPVHFVVPPLLSREDTTGYDRPPLASTAPQQPAAPSGPVLHTTCLICSRPLTDYDSMVRGVGPTCWNRL
jgi:hypothetical protein